MAYIWFGITINLANALSDKGKGCTVNANNGIMHVVVFTLLFLLF